MLATPLLVLFLTCNPPHVVYWPKWPSTGSYEVDPKGQVPDEVDSKDQVPDEVDPKDQVCRYLMKWP